MLSPIDSTAKRYYISDWLGDNYDLRVLVLFRVSPSRATTDRCYDRFSTRIRPSAQKLMFDYIIRFGLFILVVSPSL